MKATEIVKKLYICECGRKFDNPQCFNGHKSNCEIHHLSKWGNLDVLEAQKNTLRCGSLKSHKNSSERSKIENADKLSRWVSEKHTCEKCGKVMTEYYGSGRFCSKSCASSFSTSLKRKEISAKVSISLTGTKHPPSEKQLESLRKLHTEIIPAYAEIRKSKRLVKVGNDTLDITVKDLEEYRKTHIVCDICGQPEKTYINGKPKKLSIEHDHNTGKFRGLVCNFCNTKLAWFDKYRDTILEYISK